MINNNTFNGYPSIVLPKRPFFSIIIPCYNSGKTLGALLESIAQQEMNDEIEVILSDDHSTESYQDIVEQYNQTLSIRQVQTEYNFAPGNTRQRGVEVAEGQWLCFADHDDEFIPNTLSIVKDAILETQEPYFVLTDFYEVNAETHETIREMNGVRNWMHGKFYNRDNFWMEYGIHFKKDLLTHEDIYTSSFINSVMHALNREPLYLQLYTYKWMARATSISHEYYGDHTFLETFYKDYIESTGWVYLSQYTNGVIDYEYAVDAAIDVLLYCYFYMQGFKHCHPVDWLRDNETFARNYFTAIKQHLRLSNQFILNYCRQNESEKYEGVRDFAKVGVGPFIETETFAQWLDTLHKDLTPKITMKDAMRKV